MSVNLTAVSLFAGIQVGGFDLALERAGVKVVAAVEIDPAARKVLARHFPDTVLFEDVREVTGDALRAAGFVPERGIVTAGWPCQGNSPAGHRKGLADPRSGLWSHVVRLLAVLRPAWFFGENVAGLLSVNRGADFAVVLNDLAKLGMGFCWRVMDAQFLGVAQQRRRVIVVGRAGGDTQGPVEILFDPEGGGGHPASRRQTGQVVAAPTANGVGAGGDADDNAAQAGHLIAVPVTVGMPATVHTLTSEGADASEDGTGRGAPLVPMASIPQNGAELIPDGVRRTTPLEWERLQGFPDGWTAGQSDAARYRQCGNAVPVPMFEHFAHRIVAVDSREVHDMTTSTRTRSLAELVRDFSLAMNPGRHCPGCDCCTRSLCEAGSQHPSGCIGLTGTADPELRARIASCPCATQETARENGGCVT